MLHYRSKSKEICLFVLWNTARVKEEEILDEIGQKFRILKKYGIRWAPEKFNLNADSFYGDNLSEKIPLEAWSR